jgi:hypothetical protein
MTLVTPTMRPVLEPGTLRAEWFKNVASVRWDSQIRPTNADYWLWIELLEATGWAEELIVRLNKSHFSWEMSRPRLHLPSQVLVRVPPSVASWIWETLPLAYEQATARFYELRSNRRKSEIIEPAQVPDAPSTPDLSPTPKIRPRMEAGSD